MFTQNFALYIYYDNHMTATLMVKFYANCSMRTLPDCRNDKIIPSPVSTTGERHLHKFLPYIAIHDSYTKAKFFADQSPISLMTVSCPHHSAPQGEDIHTTLCVITLTLLYINKYSTGLLSYTTFGLCLMLIDVH